MRKICTLPFTPAPFIYLFIYISMDWWIFIFFLWSVMLYFVAYILLGLAIWHLGIFDMSLFSCFGACFYFLILQDAPVSSCIFPAPAPESAISPRSSGFFYWKKIFRNQDLVSKWTGCTHSYWAVTASRPSSRADLGNTCVCTGPGVHTYLCLFPYLCINTNMCSYWSLWLSSSTTSLF